MEADKKDEIKKFTIREMAAEDRPQERLLAKGPESLTNAELIALIIRTGTKTKTSVELAQEILNGFPEYSSLGISALKKKSINDFMKIKGVGIGKASMLIASITLASRMASESMFNKKRILSPKDILDIVMEDMKNLSTEEFRIVILNTKKEIITIRTISSGTLDTTIVHPREVFKAAIDFRAHTILLLHNHPSGDSSPSNQDISLTDRLVKAGNILGIEVVDHIIIGNGNYYSFKEQGII
ncbi:RadC family protein [Peptoniphilus catoniae]|uniref:RadC family protein n=1 Tax=Peptoniphilus catoniae TaxID=1660341 RepID=UPI0010FE20E8|nr:DNA repair protein RadC [Peptoniphilus catoniae]